MSIAPYRDVIRLRYVRTQLTNFEQHTACCSSLPGAIRPNDYQGSLTIAHADFGEDTTGGYRMSGQGYCGRLYHSGGYSELEVFDRS
jgi:hypothetical protein